MENAITFQTRQDFRAWLSENCRTHEGVWLLFGKPGGPNTLKAGEALEEALCFGWIDGQMKKLDNIGVHGQDVRTCLLQGAVLILKFLPVDGPAASAMMVCDVATLAHT